MNISHTVKINLKEIGTSYSVFNQYSRYRQEKVVLELINKGLTFPRINTELMTASSINIEEITKINSKECFVDYVINHVKLDDSLYHKYNINFNEFDEYEWVFVENDNIMVVKADNKEDAIVGFLLNSNGAGFTDMFALESRSGAKLVVKNKIKELESMLEDIDIESWDFKVPKVINLYESIDIN